MTPARRWGRSDRGRARRRGTLPRARPPRRIANRGGVGLGRGRCLGLRLWFGRPGRRGVAVDLDLGGAEDAAIGTGGPTLRTVATAPSRLGSSVVTRARPWWRALSNGSPGSTRKLSTPLRLRISTTWRAAMAASLLPARLGGVLVELLQLVLQAHEIAEQRRHRLGELAAAQLLVLVVQLVDQLGLAAREPADLGHLALELGEGLRGGVAAAEGVELGLEGALMLRSRLSACGRRWPKRAPRAPSSRMGADRPPPRCRPRARAAW